MWKWNRYQSDIFQCVWVLSRLVRFSLALQDLHHQPFFTPALFSQTFLEFPGLMAVCVDTNITIFSACPLAFQRPTIMSVSLEWCGFLIFFLNAALITVSQMCRNDIRDWDMEFLQSICRTSFLCVSLTSSACSCSRWSTTGMCGNILKTIHVFSKIAIQSKIFWFSHICWFLSL